MQTLTDLIKKKGGYSLVEILVALVIVSGAMIVSTSSIFSSARIAIDNEMADRANTMSIRVLELVKKPDKKIPECNTNQEINFMTGQNFSVGNINLTSAVNANNVCFKSVPNLGLVTECTVNSVYKTSIVFDFGKYQDRHESFCIQVVTESLPNTKFTKVTVRTVYYNLSKKKTVKTLYGLL